MAPGLMMLWPGCRKLLPNTTIVGWVLTSPIFCTGDAKAPFPAGRLSRLTVLTNTEEKSYLAPGTLTFLQADEEEQGSKAQRAMQNAVDERVQGTQTSTPVAWNYWHRLNTNSTFSIHQLPFLYTRSLVFNVKHAFVISKEDLSTIFQTSSYQCSGTLVTASGSSLQVPWEASCSSSSQRCRQPLQQPEHQQSTT